MQDVETALTVVESLGEALALPVAERPKRPRPSRAKIVLSVRQTILVAVWRWQGMNPLPAAEVVMLAWRMNPTMFGLRGHEAKHPDANKVLSKLSGSGNLVARGWMERAGIGVWRVTEKGWSEAQRLAKRARVL
jgi:hypothetical protein